MALIVKTLECNELDVAPAFSRNEVWKLVGKIATFYYGLDCSRSGKLSRENDGLESCSREKDVAPSVGLTVLLVLVLDFNPFTVHNHHG